MIGNERQSEIERPLEGERGRKRKIVRQKEKERGR